MPALIASYLVNAAWQIPLVALCVLGAARFGALSPRGRHGLWLAGLAAAALLPAVSLRSLIPQPAPVVARVAPVAASVPLAEPIAPATAAPAGAAATNHLIPALEIPPGVAWSLVAAVAAFALALAIRLVLAAAAAQRLVRGARLAALPPQAAEALEALAIAHGRRAPPVLQSQAVRSPAVVGALRPVILLPQDLAAEPEELRAALLHEMAHVVRNDYAVNLACELLTLPVCWHPALMGLKAGVRASRELACDAIAASAMASRKAYAQCLVSLARSLGEPAARNPNRRLEGGAQTALAVGLFGRSDLEDRLMHLMKPREKDAPFVGAARALGLAAVGAGVLGSAALLHVTPVMARTEPLASPAPVAQAALAAPVAPVAPVAPAAPDAAPAPPAAPAAPAPPATPHRHARMIYSRDGVILERGPSGYRHTWTGADGEAITVVDDDPAEPSADRKQRWEAESKEAEARAARAEAYVNSPEFKAKIAKAQAEAEKAAAMVNSPEFKARIARAAEEGAKASAYVNSPEFKAQIARATAESARVQAVVNSPEFKARIAKAAAEGAKAAALVDSPEFKARMAKLQRDMDAMGDRMAHDLDDLPAPGPTPSPAPRAAP